MVFAVKYTIKGVRKGYKKYQAHQLEKQEAAKGVLPDLDDPSCELNAACLAERSNTRSTQSSRYSTSSTSTQAAEKALENDPEFQEYMDRQRALYLQQHQGHPPAYEIVSGRVEMPAATASSPVELVSAVSDGEHCTCHNCVVIRHSQSPISGVDRCTRVVQELPAPMGTINELEVPGIQINRNSSQSFNSSSPQFDKDDLVLCEMPGDMPAVLPEKKSQSPSELPAAPT